MLTFSVRPVYNDTHASLGETNDLSLQGIIVDFFVLCEWEDKRAVSASYRIVSTMVFIVRPLKAGRMLILVLHAIVESPTMNAIRTVGSSHNVWVCKEYCM